MRRTLPDLRRCTLALQRSGLHSAAANTGRAWLAAAHGVGNRGQMVEAGARLMALAIDADRPAQVLEIGAGLLPEVLDTTTVEPELKARFYILLAKAAWETGRDREMTACIDAAAEAIEDQPVHPLVRAHLAIVACVRAHDNGAPLEAVSWALQAVELAEAAGDEATLRLAKHNLSCMWAQAGELDRAERLITQLTSGTETDPQLVDVFVDAIDVALARGDVLRAGAWARRAVAAYCESPSALRPLSIAFLAEALGRYHAARGQARVASLLWQQSAKWFAVRQHERDAERAQDRIRAIELHAPRGGPDAGVVDPELLYLTDVCETTRRGPRRTSAHTLAAAVHRLMDTVAPLAERTPSEHAALLYGLRAAERWFTRRSLNGRAAERVLGGQDARGRDGLEVLAAYERLAATGTNWRESIRQMRRGGLERSAVDALNALYRAATA